MELDPSPVTRLSEQERASKGGGPDESAPSESARVQTEDLLRGSARSVLERIANGDPLEMAPRVARAISARNVLLDTDQAQLHALARVARYARRRPESVKLGAWLDGQAETSVDELLRSELELEAGAQAEAETGTGVEDGAGREVPAALAQLARPLGLVGAGLWAACRAHNRATREDRRVFAAVVLERGDMEAVAEAEGIPLTKLARRLRRMLESVLAAASHAGQAATDLEDAR